MDEHTLDDRWEDVLADAEATVEEYRENGWEAMWVHAGDVNPVADDARLDVLVSGPEFDEVNERMAHVAVDGFRVFAAHEGGVAFRLVAAEDESSGFALCIPTFLLDRDAEPLHRAAAEAGELIVRLRPLDDRGTVDLRLVEPEVYFESKPPA